MAREYDDIDNVMISTGVSWIMARSQDLNRRARTRVGSAKDRSWWIVQGGTDGAPGIKTSVSPPRMVYRERDHSEPNLHVGYPIVPAILASTEVVCATSRVEAPHAERRITFALCTP